MRLIACWLLSQDRSTSILFKWLCSCYYTSSSIVLVVGSQAFFPLSSPDSHWEKRSIVVILLGGSMVKAEQRVLLSDLLDGLVSVFYCRSIWWVSIDDRYVLIQAGLEIYRVGSSNTILLSSPMLFSHSPVEVKLRAIWLLLDKTSSDGTPSGALVFVAGDNWLDILDEAFL